MDQKTSSNIVSKNRLENDFPKSIFITGESSHIGQMITDNLKNEYKLVFLINLRTISIPGVKIQIVERGLASVAKHSNDGRNICTLFLLLIEIY